MERPFYVSAFFHPTHTRYGGDQHETLEAAVAQALDFQKTWPGPQRPPPEEAGIKVEELVHGGVEKRAWVYRKGAWTEVAPRPDTPPLYKVRLEVPGQEPTVVPAWSMGESREVAARLRRDCRANGAQVIIPEHYGCAWRFQRGQWEPVLKPRSFSRAKRIELGEAVRRVFALMEYQGSVLTEEDRYSRLDDLRDQILGNLLGEDYVGHGERFMNSGIEAEQEVVDWLEGDDDDEEGDDDGDDGEEEE